MDAIGSTEAVVEILDSTFGTMFSGGSVDR